jgi:predicted dehydrogenase
MGQPMRVAIAGCGTIANVMHLPGLVGLAERGLVELVAACDIAATAVGQTAARFGIPHSFTDLTTMLAAVDFDLLVNATRIPDHFGVSRQALQAGRHVYTQKPMTGTVAEADELIALAARQGRLLAAHPEHPVRSVIRTMRRLIDTGAIGQPTFAIVRSSHDGPEQHDVPRDSTWFYQPGSDPILDMGVHGLSQITALLGPVRQVSCLAGRSRPVRLHTAGPFSGKPIAVNIDDNSLLLLDFGQAVFAFLDATYCVPATLTPQLEIYGSAGTLSLAQREAGGGLQLYRSADGRWQPVEVPADPPLRDLGLLHTVEALRGDQPLLLTAERGRHLVELMVAAPAAAQQGRTITLTTTF